jgi:DNA-binding HxlR family transcriptional regulator/putative sterol carrier protein
MSTKRTYGDVCGVARALDLVGERWALLVVRELLLGPKRFTDLRGDLPHVGPDVLTQRLRDLAEAGIVRRRRLPPPAASQVYELTELGAELEPVVMALGRWGALLPVPAGAMAMSFDAHILSLRTLFDPERADGLRAHLELRLGDQRFHAEVADGHFEIERGEATAPPDAVIESDAGTVLAIAHGRRELDEALQAGELAIEGDADVASRFLGLFPLPECALHGQPA